MATKKTKKNSQKVTTLGRKKTTFQVKANPGSKVYLSGTFNEWGDITKPLKDIDGKGNYAVTLFLPQGDHEYKYIIDGEWHVDPECPRWVQNDCGTLNSLVTVQ